MGNILWFPTLTAVGLLASPAALSGEARESADSSWTSQFSVAKCDVAGNGRNPYFILEPGYQLMLEGNDASATITVKDEIRIIDHVETRVVETRETQGDELIEICRNYYAINKKTNDVLCFGQDVDIYLGGRVVAHDGAWSAGVGDARVGLKLSGRPYLYEKHYQEVAPGVALTRAEVMELGVAVSSNAVPQLPDFFHELLMGHPVEIVIHDVPATGSRRASGPRLTGFGFPGAPDVEGKQPCLQDDQCPRLGVPNRSRLSRLASSLRTHRARPTVPTPPRRRLAI